MRGTNVVGANKANKQSEIDLLTELVWNFHVTFRLSGSSIITTATTKVTLAPDGLVMVSADDFSVKNL